MSLGVFFGENRCASVDCIAKNAKKRQGRQGGRKRPDSSPGRGASQGGFIIRNFLIRNCLCPSVQIGGLSWSAATCRRFGKRHRDAALRKGACCALGESVTCPYIRPSRRLPVVICVHLRFPLVNWCAGGYFRGAPPREICVFCGVSVYAVFSDRR